ncbi:hypothetical protein DEI86_09860 [Curtobacterium sp. MCBD17_028]|nr:hypothetical protein DEI86_09860 [Curtobacterium sp. MCBD17_028]
MRGTVRSGSHDGGIDVESGSAVARVKRQGATVGAGVVQQLYGATQAAQKSGKFYTTSSYSRDAIAFARRVGVKLYVVDEVRESARRSTVFRRVLRTPLWRSHPGWSAAGLPTRGQPPPHDAALRQCGRSSRSPARPRRVALWQRHDEPPVEEHLADVDDVLVSGADAEAVLGRR